MKGKKIPAVAIIVISLCTLGTLTIAAQDRFTVKALNGVAFSECRGYETWPDVEVSQTEDGIKAILGNAVMIRAYGKAFPAIASLFPKAP